MKPDSGEISGLILAGGAGVRMGGRDKGWVTVGGAPLIVQIIDRFAPQVSQVLISANRNIERYRELPQVSAVVSDSCDGYQGPLAGVLAGLAAAPSAYLAIVPCDCPALPFDLVSQLARGMAGGRAAYARADGREHPTFALLAREARPALQDYFATGGRALRHAWQAVDAAVVDFGDEAGFANVNVISVDD